MEKMTIHRGLAELKLIDSRIMNAVQNFMPSGHKQKDKKIFTLYEEEDFKKKAIGDFDSILALIERKNKIKCAIVRINGETKITVAGKEMTIADAINFKTLIGYKKSLINEMKAKHRKVLSEIEKGNTAVDMNLQRLLEATFGKENVKASEADAEAVSKPFLERNKIMLVDPLNVEEKVAKLEEEVFSFEAEVDATLSEINAVTFIEF